MHMYGGDSKSDAKVAPNVAKDEEVIPDQFLCPVGLDLMKDPVIIADGISYERSVIEDWFKKNKDTSPMTNEKLTHLHLTPNINLRQLIEEYKVKKVVDKRRMISEEDLLSAIQTQQKFLEQYQETNGQALKSAQQHAGKLQQQLSHLQAEQKRRELKQTAAANKTEQYVKKIEMQLQSSLLTQQQRENELLHSLEEQKQSVVRLQQDIATNKINAKSRKRLNKKNENLNQALQTAQKKIAELEESLQKSKIQHAVTAHDLEVELDEKKLRDAQKKVVDQKSDSKSTAAASEEDDGYYSEDEDPHSLSSLELDAQLQFINREYATPYFSNTYLTVLTTTRKREVSDNCLKYKKNKSYDRSLEYRYNDRLLQQISQNVWHYLSLDLRCNDLDDCAIIKLVRALETNTYIKKLNVSWNKFGVVGATALAANKTLVALIMFHNLQLGNAGAKALAANNTWLALDVSSCNIEDAGVEALAANKNLIALAIGGNSFLPAKNFGFNGVKALASNNTLRILKLNWNNIGDTGAELLASNNNLLVLEVDHCNIGFSGAKAFAANKILRQLYINGNHVGKIGAIALAKNQTLCELGINSNNLIDEDIKIFATNQILTSFYYRRNTVSSETDKAVQEMLKKNQQNKKNGVIVSPAASAGGSYDAKHDNSSASQITFFAQAKTAAGIKKEEDIPASSNGCVIS